jgi:outer membrane lipoprotein-sorting protein
MSTVKYLRNCRCLHLFASCLLSIFILIQPAVSCANNLIEVPPEERPKIVEQFRAAHKRTHSVSASVMQEKQLAALKKKVLIGGTIVMSRPNMLKWDVLKPVRSLTVIDGETMTVFHPDANEAQVYVLSDHVIARSTLGFFSTVMGGDLSQMEAKFEVSILKGGNEIVFKLVPISKLVSKYIAEVIIHYDSTTYLPLGFEMNTHKGDKTITKLTNFKVNPEIGPDTFHIKLPKNVWVTNRTETANN